MATKVLTLETLKDLDFGKATATFQQALKRAVLDCMDRPGDNRARKVVFQLSLVPVKEIHENVISCEGAKGTFQVKTKIPDYETDEVDFGVQTNGQLFFSEESPRNHKQATLWDGDGEEDAARE